MYENCKSENTNRWNEIPSRMAVCVVLQMLDLRTQNRTKLALSAIICTHQPETPTLRIGLVALKKVGLNHKVDYTSGGI